MKIISFNGVCIRCLLVVIWISLISACAKQETVSLDIQASSADRALKDFAKQAGVEIIFDANSVENIDTNEVKGNLQPGEALAMMLDGTLLTIEEDPKTGAFAIKKTEK